MARKDTWTREQLIMALNVYCKIPFKDVKEWHPIIQKYAPLIGRKLAEMGWHCITVWECELKPSKQEETLDAIAFTLNHIWLQDHRAKHLSYPQLEEENMHLPMAAEDYSSGCTQ